MKVSRWVRFRNWISTPGLGPLVFFGGSFLIFFAISALHIHLTGEPLGGR